MTVWVFHSTDTGLAGLVGNTAGTLITALDACLVNGVNSTASGWSAAWAGGIATYTRSSAHNLPVGAPGVVVTVTGFTTYTGYNVTATTVNVNSATTFQITMADPGGVPGGTATVIRSPLGWSKAFSGTNLATYRQKSGTNQFYLAIDDTLTLAQNDRLRGFETASAAGPANANGTGGFPTEAQLAGGCYMYRSSAADATVRPWLLVSDGKIIYFFLQHSGVTTTGGGFIFGDITTYKTSDIYHTILVADIASSATTSSLRISNVSATLVACSGHYMPRSYTGVGSSLNVGKHGNAAFMNGASEMGAGGMTYPIGVEGGLMLTPTWVSEITNGIRGHLPGLWAPCHSRPLGHGDTFSGVAATPLAGKTFECFNTGSGAQMIVETSDTWDA